MTLTSLRLLEHVHGHLGWLTVAMVTHPAIVLRQGRRAPWAVGLAGLFASGTSLLGYVLYPEYRARIRQHLFQDAPQVAWLFERKEHLAFGALALAWAGIAAYLAGRRSDDREASRLFQRAARLAFAASAVLAALVAAFGISVAVTRTF